MDASWRVCLLLAALLTPGCGPSLEEFRSFALFAGRDAVTFGGNLFVSIAPVSVFPYRVDSCPLWPAGAVVQWNGGEVPTARMAQMLPDGTLEPRPVGWTRRTGVFGGIASESLSCTSPTFSESLGVLPPAADSVDVLELRDGRTSIRAEFPPARATFEWVRPVDGVVTNRGDVRFRLTVVEPTDCQGFIDMNCSGFSRPVAGPPSGGGEYFVSLVGVPQGMHHCVISANCLRKASVCTAGQCALDFAHRPMAVTGVDLELH